MSYQEPAYTIPRQSVDAMLGMFAKMWDPPTSSPETPDLLNPTNPVPELMAAYDFQKTPSSLHTVQRDLMHGVKIPTWDGAKELIFFAIRDKDNPILDGNYPAGTIRMPRGVIFHCEAQGHGPPPHTIHWHGIEPTPMNDGVGHCSFEFGQYTYQWQPNFIGTYFYPCHRNTVQHFEFGLFSLLLIDPPDAFFATLYDPSIPLGYCRDGKKRMAANVSKVLLPDGSIADYSAMFPGFNSNALTDSDPWTGDARLLYSTDPHAMTVPYDVEVLWVPDDRDSVWSDLAPDPRATYPRHGNYVGVDDNFHGNAGGGVNSDDFFAFNDFNADYFFVTGVPVPAARADRGGTGVGDIPPGIVVPTTMNSGVAGQQVSINAEVGQTILVRCLDAAYDCIEVKFPVDVTIIAWDGRALGVPPYGQYNSAYVVPANTHIHMSVAQRFDALIKVDSAIDSFATVDFFSPREQVPGLPHPVEVTARIPITICYSLSGKVTDGEGNPLAGVTTYLTGDADKTAVTDLEGSYKIMGLFDGSYTVTPTLDGFEFAPLSQAITISGASVTGQDFEVTQTAELFVITGSVVTSRSALSIPGVQMTLEGSVNRTAVTGAAGNFILSGLPDGLYTITPSLAGFAFSPTDRRVRIRGTNQTLRLFRGRGVV